MLNGNAIVVTQSIKARIEAGDDKLTVIRTAVGQNQWPPSDATAIAFIAFAAIGLSDDATGEYCNSLFCVIFISLGLSWITAITLTPLLCYLMFSPSTDPACRDRDPYAALPPQFYKKALIISLRLRWGVLLVTQGMFVAGVYGFGHVRQKFFPPATRPQFLVDAFLPAGADIKASQRFAAKVGEFIKTQPGVKDISSLIGGGGLSFLLVYSPDKPNPAFVQFLVGVDDSKKICGLMSTIQTYLDDKHPSGNAIAKKSLLGPDVGGRVQTRFSGRDPEVLRRLSAEAREMITRDTDAVCVHDD